MYLDLAKYLKHANKKAVFAFSYIHGGATLCMMSSAQTERVLLPTLKQVCVALIPGSNPGRYLRRGARVIVSENLTQFLLRAKLIESCHPAGDIARRKGRRAD